MARPEPLLAPDLDIGEYLLEIGPRWRARAIEALGPEDRGTFDAAWEQWAHPGQLAPPGAWSTWVVKAGRGFGKTRAGAEWIVSLVAAGEAPLRIALVGATLEDARRVMVEGRSGLIEVGAGWVSDWEPSLGRLSFRTGASAQLFSGASPEMLRGPEHHYAWCDELAKWDKAQECWDMLQLGLRLAPPDGLGPRAIVTTTPRAGTGTTLQAILDDPATELTGGPSRANPHLPRAWHARVERLYAGTRLGRQELDGEIILDAAGALWTVELIERCRRRSDAVPRSVRAEPVEAPPSSSSGSPEVKDGPSTGSGRTEEKCSPRFTRTLIAVDPPTVDGTCGIVACAREGSGDQAIAHVLADHSVTARSPEGWARAVAAAAEAHGTIEVIAEANQGGEMVKAVLHTADPRLRVKLVHARAGKTARAEPVAHLFEAGRAVLHGRMPELEAQLLGMIAGGGYEGPGDSPDRADAMVWGVAELMLGRRVEPRVWVV